MVVIKGTPAGGGPLVPGLSKAFRARRASLRSSARSRSPGPVRNQRGAGEGRFTFLLNRLFSSPDPDEPEFPNAFGALRIPAGSAWIDAADPLKVKIGAGSLVPHQ